MTIRERIRSHVDEDPQARELAYMQGHEEIMQTYNRLVDEFSARQSQAITEARRLLYRGGGTENYQRCLAQASNTPDEKLPELAALAQQSGLRDLEQAVAIVSAQRNPGGTSEIFRNWV